DDMVAVFRVNNDDKATRVAVDPYTAKVVNTMPRGQGWYHTRDEIHGDIMLGATGDYLLETAASLTIIMCVTGIYLCWVKQRSLKAV
ncbi:PepSY domain-containing protein, partial [Neisseria sp. P0001.S005]|uniref:PepSY domain-containing protein n=1 Tax=Neisseria sp. P0001.S005 TaxID=3436649 RepID=UPI003F7D41D9